MNERKIPKTLIKKDGTMSPEIEYNMLHAMEMIIGAAEYLLDNDPKTPEEGLKYIKLGNELMALSDFHVDPESKLGILFRRVNDIKSAKIQEKLDKLERKARQDIESGLLKEEINLNIEDLNKEFRKNRSADDS